MRVDRVRWVLIGCGVWLWAAATEPALAYTQRVICGNTMTAHTDIHGYVWEVDRTYAAGSWGYLGTDNHAVFPGEWIENTTDPALYRCERLNQAYRFDVPAAGRYYVKFLWCENWWGISGHAGPGARVFDVSVNGSPVFDDLNILQETGGRARRALIKEAVIDVSDAGGYPLTILIEVSASVDQAKFSALEISDQPTLTDTQDSFYRASASGEEVYRINCGGMKTRTPDSALWMADEPFAFCSRWGYAFGTPAQVSPPAWSGPEAYLLETWREWTATGSYRLDVPNGSYLVKLVFCDYRSSGDGQRVFDVGINGVPVAVQLDVHAAAGPGVSYERQQSVTVSDETLEITLTKVTGAAFLNALEVKAVSVADNDFLDFVQRRTLRFFTNSSGSGATVNPSNGLVVDRAKNFLPEDPADASIAAVGFGAAVISSAVARGWLGAIQARLQLDALLDMLVNAEPYTGPEQTGATHKNGFYFHFLDLDTARRSGVTEVSPIDTSLLFAGLLTASRFLPGTGIDQKTTLLANRAEWSWFDDSNSQGFVANHWTPEEGFPPYCWSGYNEDVLMDILGLGSSTYPLTTGCWFNMTRVWETLAGHPVMIEVAGSPTGLFTHTYPYCFLDARGRQDDKNDYFANTRLAAQADHDYCANRSGVHATYADGGWGLSAGDSPRGGLTYYAYRMLDWENDGTVNPAILGSALPFWPEGVLPEIRRIYFQYKQFIWGRFGFSSSYNLSAPKTDSLDNSGQGWVSPDVIGIDLGALYLGIENYRTQSVWDRFMENPDVVRGCARAGWFSLIIDDFENDGSRSDQAMVRDGGWTSRGDAYVLGTAQNVYGNSGTCLRVDLAGSPVAGEDQILLGQLNQVANMSYFLSRSALRMHVYGLSGHLRLRLTDMQGRSTDFSELLPVQSAAAWQEVAWDYGGADWGACNLRQIEHITLECVPDGDMATFYIDTINLDASLTPPAPPADEASPTVRLGANPARGQVVFLCPAFGETEAVIDVYALSGDRVARIREQVAGDPGQTVKVIWNCPEAAAGLYLARVRIFGAGEEKVRCAKKIALLK